MITATVNRQVFLLILWARLVGAQLARIRLPEPGMGEPPGRWMGSGMMHSPVAPTHTAARFEPLRLPHQPC